MKTHSTAIAVLGFVATFGVLGVVATQLTLTDNDKPNHFGFWSAVAIGALMLVLVLWVGWAAKGRVDGVLIDRNNRATLAQFQMVVWTLVILASYAGAVFTNLMSGTAAVDALEVSVPPELWLAMGIAGTSLVGSKVIKATIPRDDLASNASPGAASWEDMFT